MTKWYVETKYIEDWIGSLDDKTRTNVYAALKRLAAEGPNLNRPLVDSITGSRYHNMKELRPGSSKNAKIRILFIFDPERHAILLVAGDKANSDKKWQKWYNINIPRAEDIYEEHLKTLNS